MKQQISPEQLLKELRDNPGAHILLIGHTATCPALQAPPSGCTCNPYLELVSGAEILRQTMQRRQRTPRG
jgi:hypothetical protein